MTFDGGDETTRRTALKSGATAVSLLAVGSLSGCSSIPFLSGGGSYTEWVPAPDGFQESESLTVYQSKPSEIADNEDNFDEDYYDENLENDVDKLDIDYEDMTLNIGVLAGFSLPVQVYDGDYEAQTVVDALEDEDTGEGPFAEDGEYEGYTVYLNDSDDAPDNPQTAYGLDGTLVVEASATEDLDAEEMLELVIDTNNGDGTLFTDDSEDFSALTDELGDGTTLVGGVSEDASEEDDPDNGSFEGAVASGRVVTVNGETSDLKYVVVWDSEGDADEGDLEDYADNALDDEFDPNDDPSVGVSGRVGTIEFTYDTDELTSGI